ncbi:MAG: GGDEF domain-containing protein [Thermoanaerobaculia bacterium]|nr:GGDEF domain-containing protein [Thermoanaerobaculia bacterium]
MKSSTQSPPPYKSAAAKASQPSLWRDLLHRIWTAPDPELVDAGLRGEWLIAGIRLLIVVLLLYFPLSQYWDAPLETSRRWILWVAAGALAEALVVYSAVMRSWGRQWIGFLSGVLDVSLVTLSLWIFVILDRPLQAVGELVIFSAYFLAIGATSLRYDWRICTLTGVTAIVEYLGLALLAAWHHRLLEGTEALQSASFSWGPQIGRLALLAAATLLATTIVDRAYDQRRLSTRDRLTDLANRGFFDESLSRMGALAERSGQPVTVAMIDVDHFKRFNDTYGHQAGDKALQAVAAMLTRSFRTTDLVARYGGEEFVGLFPGMDRTDALNRLEQLRVSIAKMPVTLDGRVTQVTVSIGAAVWPQDAVNLKEALTIADMRLYRAKGAGRNRVVATQGDRGEGEKT